MTVVQLGCFSLIDPPILEEIEKGGPVYLIDANPESVRIIAEKTCAAITML